MKSKLSRPVLYYVMRTVILALFGAICGSVILWADAYAVEIFDILLIAMGIIAVISNLPMFALSLRAVIGKTRWEWINLVLSLLGIGLGLCFAFLQRGARILPFLLLLYAVVLPVIRVFLVERRGMQLRREMPKFFFGVFMLIVSLCEAEDVLFTVLGFIFIGVSALYLLFRLVTMSTYFEMQREMEEDQQEEE